MILNRADPNHEVPAVIKSAHVPDEFSGSEDRDTILVNLESTGIEDISFLSALQI